MNGEGLPEKTVSALGEVIQAVMTTTTPMRAGFLAWTVLGCVALCRAPAGDYRWIWTCVSTVWAVLLLLTVLETVLIVFIERGIAKRLELIELRREPAKPSIVPATRKPRPS